MTLLTRLQCLLVAAVFAPASVGPALADSVATSPRLPIELRLAQGGPAAPVPPPGVQVAAPRSGAAQAVPPVEDEVPAYKRWWFWALTAAVVGGTIALGALAIDPSTPQARGCTADALACFGDGR